jgi:CPA1 family monovalent cation:H+ antiporter
MDGQFSFILLFVVATAVAIGARWLRLPYTVALVIAGLVLGASHAFAAPHLTKQLLFTLILPGLIFEAAFHLDAATFWRERIAINALAVPGVVVALAITAVMLAPVVNAFAFAAGFTFVHAMVFAALIVATDPIAVVALFKSIGAPKRLTLIVEGESLVNDGTGIVLFAIVVGFATGGHPSVRQAVFDFVRVVGVGGVIGSVIGFGLAQLIRRIDEPMIELTITIIAAYGSFAVAEHFHGSGVIATLMAGMLCGNYAARIGMSPTSRVAVETAWEYGAFALNSIIFLLIGFEVQLGSLAAAWKPIVLAYAAVMVGRAALVYAVTALLRKTRGKIPWSWSAIVTWSGLRGTLSMVLALSLPVGFPHRELLLNMTFGVVILSILLQGLTMGPLLRLLGLRNVRTDAEKSHERHKAALEAAVGALAELDRVEAERTMDPPLLEQLRSEYRQRLEHEEAALRELHGRSSELDRDEERTARRRAILAERDAVLQAVRHGALAEEAVAQTLADIDQRLRALIDEKDERPGATRQPR